jgi:uncharacterized protein (TIGR00730 family)
VRWCVFCGASDGNDPRFLAYAAELGAALANAGRELVYGGGRTGLMGAVADGAIAAGGHVIGIIPQHLDEREVAHNGISDLRVVGSMHERKALMAELSDAFIALPGGVGTLDELFDMLSWRQLGLHAKPIGLLNHHGFFDTLLAQLDHMVAQGFVANEHRHLLISARDLAELLLRMRM